MTLYYTEPNNGDGRVFCGVLEDCREMIHASVQRSERAGRLGGFLIKPGQAIRFMGPRRELLDWFRDTKWTPLTAVGGSLAYNCAYRVGPGRYYRERFLTPQEFGRKLLKGISTGDVKGQMRRWSKNVRYYVGKFMIVQIFNTNTNGGNESGVFPPNAVGLHTEKLDYQTLYQHLLVNDGAGQKGAQDKEELIGILQTAGLWD